MTNLDDAMAQRIAELVLVDHRAFHCGDFLQFYVWGKQFNMAYGTFRNKISKLVRKGEVVVNHRSTCTFYTLKGYKFGKPVTSHHAGAPSRISNSIYDEISSLAIGKNSLHDIRLSFNVPHIWSMLSTNSSFKINSRNKDIRMPGINIDNLFISTTVHRSDTVSVIVACSYAPIAIDIPDIIRLSNCLTRVEERLARHVNEFGILCGIDHCELSIPNHMEWIVKMWHFGADELKEYSGKRYEITYADAEGILSRIYAKQMKDNKIRRRLERQEYPKKELHKAIEEKLKANTGLGLQGNEE